MMEASIIQSEDLHPYDRALSHGRERGKLFALDLVIILGPKIESLIAFF